MPLLQSRLMERSLPTTTRQRFVCVASIRGKRVRLQFRQVSATYERTFHGPWMGAKILAERDPGVEPQFAIWVISHFGRRGPQADRP